MKKILKTKIPKREIYFVNKTLMRGEKIITTWKLRYGWLSARRPKNMSQQHDLPAENLWVRKREGEWLSSIKPKIRC